EAGDGAPAGRYLVSLAWPEDPTSREPPEDRLNWAYSDPQQSALTATIAEGETALEPFRVAPGAGTRGRAAGPRPGARRPGPTAEPSPRDPRCVDVPSSRSTRSTPGSGWSPACC